MHLDIKKVVDWLKTKNFTAAFDSRCSDYGDGLIAIKQKLVVVNPNLSESTQVVILLHECGHLLACRDVNRYAEAYPHQIAMLIDSRRGRSYKYRIGVLEEEFDVWSRAERLAGRLDIDLDKHKFYSYRTKYLMTYIDWISRRNWTEQVV